MKYTADEIRQYVAEEDIKFLRLAFCDIFGSQKNISILPDELERALTYGIAFDASAVPGFGDEVHSDLFLHPDTGTLCMLPWRPDHGRVARMFCHVLRPNGAAFDADCRALLRQAVADAEQMGISFSFGTEMEFYLFRRDDNGEPTRIPYDNAGYMDIAPEDKGENVRREICLTLEQMGIRPECSHHEQGPGQNEIDFRYSDPLTAADNAVTFRAVVNSVAVRNGLAADFSPKPLADKPGNGMHINISAKSRDGEDVMPRIIAGILSHVAEMTVFLNTREESYHRFGSSKAPRYISWSSENRSPDPHPRRAGRVPPGGAALSRPAVQPVSGLHAADPGGAGRHKPPSGAARRRQCELLHRARLRESAVPHPAGDAGGRQNRSRRQRFHRPVPARQHHQSVHPLTITCRERRDEHGRQPQHLQCAGGIRRGQIPYVPPGAAAGGSLRAVVRLLQRGGGAACAAGAPLRHRHHQRAPAG